MKLLVICSSLDLEAPLSATPAWWQLLKGLYEVGVDLVVTTYHGRAVSTPWWRAYANPAKLEGDVFARARRFVRQLRPTRIPAATARGESRRQRAERRLAWRVVAPKWKRHLFQILKRESGIGAVLFVSTPPNHLRGVAGAIREAHRIPVLFFDGDVPASLPRFQGFATGFRIYDGADLSEYDAVLSNSEGGGDTLRELGARSVHTIHYAADPDLYSPSRAVQDIDVFFYGHTSEYRAPWIEAMIAGPSAAMPDLQFAVRGRELGDLGRAQLVADVPFSQLRHFVARSRINLAITRQPHADTPGSSTMRPFELAMMGACIVSNPYCGIERWFEPDREIVVIRSQEEAMDRYRFLLAHEPERKRLGDAARRRALAEHTFRHRATELVSILERYV
jgi:hypothetical protein